MMRKKLGAYFDIRTLFIPLSVERIKITYPGPLHPWAGFMRIRIFGLRIAEIQIANPWD
jgi:hypothetical protein